MIPRVTAVGEATSLADRKRQAGQRLYIGFAGPKVDDDLRRLVREIQPAGFVLFKRNVEDPEQVRELNRELVSLSDRARPALIAVDQEGGRVQRVREPATRWPAMRALGRAQTIKRPPGPPVDPAELVPLTAEVSRAMARELRAMGFHVNFAPVADVDSNPKNPIIGDRAFSDRPEDVAAHVVAFLQAHQAEGIAACAKHFPGHGDTTQDSHLHLPLIEREERDLRAVELPPFAAAVRAGVASVMTAHVLFAAFDEELPATLSPRVTRRLLRDELGYDGVVFSDDLEMKAVAGRWAPEEIVTKGTDAGVDVFLCCESPKLQLDVFEALVRGQELDLGFQRACATSARRVMSMRERFLLPLRPPLALDVVGTDAHKDLAMRVHAWGAA